MVLVFASSGGRHLSDSVVNSHEVGVFRELGDDFTRMYPLSLTCYRRDRHEALFGGGVHPVGDLIECLCKISYMEGFLEASVPFIVLPIALTSGVLVVIGFIGECIGRQLVCIYVFEVAIGPGTRRSLRLASSHEDLAIRGTEAGVSTCHLGWSMLLCWS
jgi:hypothetical protein